MSKSLSVESADFDVTYRGRLASIEINDFYIEQAIEYFGIGNILEEIGVHEAKKHFDLVDKE